MPSSPLWVVSRLDMVSVFGFLGKKINSLRPKIWGWKRYLRTWLNGLLVTLREHSFLFTSFWQKFYFTRRKVTVCNGELDGIYFVLNSVDRRHACFLRFCCKFLDLSCLYILVVQCTGRGNYGNYYNFIISITKLQHKFLWKVNKIIWHQIVIKYRSLIFLNFLKIVRLKNAMLEMGKCHGSVKYHKLTAIIVTKFFDINLP